MPTKSPPNTRLNDWDGQFPAESGLFLRFIWDVGLIRPLDIPMIVGMLSSPAWAWLILVQAEKPVLWFLIILLAYVFWTSGLVFRLTFFVIRTIGKVGRITTDAARMAASHLIAR